MYSIRLELIMQEQNIKIFAFYTKLGIITLSTSQNVGGI